MSRGFKIYAKVDGLKEAVESIKFYDTKAQLGVSDAISNGVKKINRLAKQRVRVRTGKLKKSGRSSFDKKTLAGKVAFRSPIAHLEEFGAKASKLAPKNKKALTIGGGSTGPVKLSKKATVPARAGRPFLFPSYQETKGEIESDIKEAISKP